ncbi:hypothetical protein F183_A26430 [Bryobacterales bacterium F-183]|nr:hypothetical protein F183_A26430 [Bryobacterales bacterium F-183]
MTDEEIVGYLDDNGYPPHIVNGGKAGLIQRWKQFVGEVEAGYPHNLHNYRNDLDIRGLIQLFSLDDEVAAEDSRLDEMLAHREVRVWESNERAPFWDFGYPRNAGWALRRDLIREGLIDAE